MKISNKTSFFLLLLFVLPFTACDDDEGLSPDEQEVITTVKLTFSDGTNATVFSYSDTDGIGGNPPVVDEITLAVNTSYTCMIEFLDESDPSNVADITEEVKEEAAEHLVCIVSTGDVPLLVPTDVDGDGNPLGLSAEMTTTVAGNGSLQVSLKHLPDKSSSTPCSTGETDVEVSFSVKIQ